MPQQPTFITLQPPPDLPNMPDVSSTLSHYLRTLSLWMRNSLAGKLDRRVALPGILLQASDPPAGTTPKVFILQVDSTGAVVVTPVSIASGDFPP